MSHIKITPKVLVVYMGLTRTRWIKVLWALSIKAKQRSTNLKKICNFFLEESLVSRETDRQEKKVENITQISRP